MHCGAIIAYHQWFSVSTSGFLQQYFKLTTNDKTEREHGF
jgi:hypothetical protein